MREGLRAPAAVTHARLFPPTCPCLPYGLCPCGGCFSGDGEARQAEPAGLAASFPGQTACRKRGPQNKQTIKGGHERVRTRPVCQAKQPRGERSLIGHAVGSSATVSTSAWDVPWRSGPGWPGQVKSEEKTNQISTRSC